MAEFILNAADFGVPGDGKTDSTERINQCLSTAVSKGYHTVWFPKGTYLIDATLGGDLNQRFRNAGSLFPATLRL
ncbi:uncharacterized protein BSBS38_00424 [Bacillus subtilis]|nr:uncharacterized protein BSBS38_00424 [Bacillus subtilis]